MLINSTTILVALLTIILTCLKPFFSVYKAKGLRVADASVMPDITSGNTQAPCYMIGEKASDMIKEDWNLI